MIYVLIYKKIIDIDRLHCIVGWAAGTENERFNWLKKQ